MNKRSRYLMLGLALIVDSLLCIFMDFCFDSMACYLLFTIDRFVRILFLTGIFLSTCDFGCYSERFKSIFVSFVLYLSSFIYFANTLISGGEIMKGTYGVYYVPLLPLFKPIYYIMYMLYFVVFMMQIMYKYTSITKKREKPEFICICLALLFVLLDQGIDIIAMSFGGNVHFPHSLFELLALCFVYRMIVHHRSSVIAYDDFADELSSERCEIAFVLNDDFKIEFCSKRAEIVAEISDDEFLDKELGDVFDIDEQTKQEIMDTHKESPFDIESIYKKLSTNVTLTIRNRMDMYGEVLASLVSVCGMEPENMINRN